jgi:hypothetical protein
LEVELNAVIGNLKDGNPIVSGGPIGVILFFAVFAILAYLMFNLPIKKLMENNTE